MIRRLSVFVCVALFSSHCVLFAATESSTRRNDLTPIAANEWNRTLATHLLERTGFGATPEEIELVSKLSPEQAVHRLVRFEGIENVPQKPFDHSGIFKTGLDPFPSSRPATTKLAELQGEALGVKVKESGNRPMQAVVNEFFYWLRASRLETDRVAQWFTGGRIE